MTYNCENILVNVCFGEFTYFLPRKMLNTAKHYVVFSFVGICVTIIVSVKNVTHYTFSRCDLDISYMTISRRIM